MTVIEKTLFWVQKKITSGLHIGKMNVTFGEHPVSFPIFVEAHHAKELVVVEKS